jgi:phosphonate transport system substrate-binding protein
MKQAFDGADRFYPITYRKDWEIIRQVATSSGERFSRETYEKEAR